MNEVRYAVEGWGDEPVAEKLIRAAGRQPRRILSAGGKSKLDPKLPGFNLSARHHPWLIIRDLDNDGDGRCFPDILARFIGGEISGRLAFRLPVRSVESWLLADRESFSDFFHVPPSKVPSDPDQLDNPKLAVVAACRSSGQRGIRLAMVPRQKSGRAVGAEYAATIREYAVSQWRLPQASVGSPSLRRTMERIRILAASGAW